MHLVTKDSLGLGLPTSIPKGTTVTLTFPKQDSFVLPEAAFLHTTDEEEYTYAAFTGTDFYLPAEYIVWGPEVMKPHGGDFHKAASQELSQAIQNSDYEGIRKGTYKLKFVQKA